MGWINNGFFSNGQLKIAQLLVLEVEAMKGRFVRVHLELTDLPSIQEVDVFEKVLTTQDLDFESLNESQIPLPHEIVSSPKLLHHPYSLPKIGLYEVHEVSTLGLNRDKDKGLVSR